MLLKKTDLKKLFNKTKKNLTAWVENKEYISNLYEMIHKKLIEHSSLEEFKKEYKGDIRQDTIWVIYDVIEQDKREVNYNGEMFYDLKEKKAFFKIDNRIIKSDIFEKIFSYCTDYKIFKYYINDINWLLYIKHDWEVIYLIKLQEE